MQPCTITHLLLLAEAAVLAEGISMMADMRKPVTVEA
jgi:hypothetical protein